MHVNYFLPLKDLLVDVQHVSIPCVLPISVLTGQARKGWLLLDSPDIGTVPRLQYKYIMFTI